MALFTDSSIIGLNDLLQFETTLVQVASTHGINVDTKINLATSAVADKLMLWLLNVGASDPQFLIRRQLGLSTVVVGTPLQRWLCFESLSRFFAEAYNAQLNTRFQGKWTEYQQEAKDAANLTFTSGLGIVYNPLPKPAMPLVSIQTGMAPGQAMLIQTAWVNSLGNEGALSPVNGILLGDNSGIAVAMAEGVENVPKSALGWNVYIGSSQMSATRQNNAPLAIGFTWELPASGLVDGPAPINGQQPDYYIRLSRQVLRG